MDYFFQRALYVSIALHIGILTIVVVWAWVNPVFQPAIEPFVFSLVEAPEFVAGDLTTESTALGDVDAIAFEAPVLEHLPPIPDINPCIMDEPIVAAIEEKKPIQNQPVVNLPVEKKISYEEFAKKKKLDKPKKQASKVAQSTDTQKLKSQVADVLKPKGTLQGAVGGKSTQIAAKGPVVDASALVRFNAELRSKIDAVWMKPRLDIDHECVTIVEFRVAANGALSEVKIVKTSGHTIFDRSVLDAFARLSNAGKPPHKEGGVYRLSFALL